MDLILYILRDLYSLNAFYVIDSISVNFPPPQKKIGDFCRFGENNGRFGLFCEKNFVVVNDFGYFRKYFERRFVKYGSYD